MSPEQAKGQRLDIRSDIFSFGATIYELASSTRAFRGDSVAEVLTAIIRDTPAELRMPIGRVVGRCLAKSPGDRYQSMREVREALESLAIRNSRDERPSIAVDQATALVFDPASSLFRLRAAPGWDASELDDVAMTLDTSRRSISRRRRRDIRTSLVKL